MNDMNRKDRDRSKDKPSPASAAKNDPFASTRLDQDMIPPRARETLNGGAQKGDTASEFNPRMFGRYRLLRPLGEGAMGTVYLALDTTLDRRVALKTPKPSGPDESREFLIRFTREAKAAAGLNHPNICRVYDAGELNGIPYLTMDFVDGVPLSQIIGSSKIQSPDAVLKIIRTIADAIKHAHSKGIIHRDLKPGNILIDDQLVPWVTDFGLARRASPSLESRMTQDGILLGTPAYMAPEQVRGEQDKVGVSSDIYSLGVVFFEMLLGRLPFDGPLPELLAKVLRDNPLEPTRLRPDLSENFNDVILKMLKKKPEHRYPNMDEVIVAIDQLMQKSTSRTVATSKTHSADNPYDNLRAHIELMLKKGQYTTAIQDLERLASQKAPAAQQSAAWARTKLPEVRAESKAMSPAGLAALLQTAQQLFQNHDYPGCIQLLEDVPTLRRTDSMQDLLRKAQQREAEAESLLDEIREKERRQDCDGLEPLVRRLLKLKPGNSHAKRLLQALQSYSKLPSARRTYRFQSGRLQPMPEPSLLKQWGLLAALTGILVFLAAYSYVIIYLRSGNQSLAVHIDDEWLKEQGGQLILTVDGNEHTITMPHSNGESLSVTVSLGEHEFAVKDGDTFVHDPRDFEIRKEGKVILQITRDDMRLVSTPDRSREEPGLASRDSGSDSKSGESSASKLNNPTSRFPGAGGIPGPGDAPDAAKWTYLFDGKSANGWQTQGPFEIRNGEMVATQRGNAISQEKYQDVEIEAEWRVGVEGNSGIYYREDASTTGLGNEYQITDPNSTKIKDDRNLTGAFYGVAPPSAKNQQPLSEWNVSRIVCNGPVVQHWLNGQKVLEYDSSSDAWKKLVADSPGNVDKSRLGLVRPGHILVQSNNGEVAYRMIRLRPTSLSADPTSNVEKENPSKTVLSFNNSSIIHSATATEVVEWSQNLQTGFGMIHLSLQANDNDATFNAVAIRAKSFEKRTTKLGIFAEKEDPQQRLFKTHRPTFIILYKDGNELRKLCAGTNDGRLWSIHIPTDLEIKSVIDEGMKGWNDVPQSVDSLHWRGNRRFSLIRVRYEELNRVGWIPAMNEGEFTSRLEKEVEGGMRPLAIQYLNDHANQTRLYCHMANNASDQNWCVTMGITADELKAIMEKVEQFEGQPFSIASIRDSGQIRFTVGWENISPEEMQTVWGAVGDSNQTTSRPPGIIGYSKSSSPGDAGEPGNADAPFAAARAKQYQERWAAKLQVPVDFTNSIGMKFRLIPPGSYTIGSTPKEIADAKPHLYTDYDQNRPDRADSEAPQQRITISRPFYLGTTEVTQQQYTVVMGSNPALFQRQGDNTERLNAPVERITWVNTGEFCQLLSQKEGLASAYQITPQMISQTGTGGYRLPTEAEWEYACRAGTETLYWCGNSEDQLREVAWYGANNDIREPKPVAQLKPNPFGLYDTHGNLWEWVHDAWRPNTYTLMTGPGAVDPRCDLGVDLLRVIRGGDHFMSAAEQRSACRDAYPQDTPWNDVGFRVAISVDAVRQRLVNSSTVNP